MAASFDLEVIEISPIELGDNFGARSLFLWIMWIDPGTTPSMGAHSSHGKSGRDAYVKAADDGFMKTRAPRGAT